MTFFPDNTANVVLAGPGEAADLPERAWYLSEHHLVGRESGGVVLASGWADYTEPKGKHLWFETARGDGAIWLGAVIEPRRFSIPVLVHRTHGQYGKPFHQVEDSFWSDIWYEYQSRLYVNTKRGVKFVDFRLDDAPAVVHDIDPEFEGFQPYLIPVVVEKTWWFGTPEEFAWRNGEPVEKKTLFNSGDRKQMPLLTLKGPGVFQIPDGVSTNVVTTPNLKAGEVVVMHTDMSVKPKSNMRSNFYGDLGGQRFRSFVPGRRHMEMSRLKCIGGNAASSAVFTIHPKSRRPF
ncbi:hypothetical protein [Rhodococcus sp. 14-2470-1a]|uniref:hypothetical protein n=1 Tax=Rhodococcus sp. 14-2470-1a TaxID=2023150 RepID=UPI000B9A9136|nr:hypothetical protein [Rhodococcus sp. 14-2470-1a]OZF47574.1 hypothetical protein CH292_19320 [Rhodococcus sp. 14-2470-1a]